MIKFNDEILKSLENIFKKYDCYLVGGYLRNYFLNGELSNDRDIVVENSKQMAQEIAQKLDGTLIELDKENEIYRVVASDKINYFDISKMVENLETDINRRDFTINSIFYDLNKGEIIDKTGGIEDIKNKIIRCNNLNNLIDDPLRMLRMYRFQAILGFKIDEELENFTKKNFSLIKKCALERINYEIIQIFSGYYTSQTLLNMFDNGKDGNILETIFPFVKKIKKIPNNTHHHLDLIHHSIETVSKIRINKPLLKLAGFYHDIGKPSCWTIEETGRHRFIGHDKIGGEIVKQELRALKFSNSQISYISKMVANHIYPASLVNCDDSRHAWARFLRKMGDDTPDVIELSRADRLSAQGPAVTKEMTEKALNHLEKLLEYYNEKKNEVQNPKPLLNGLEIMEILQIPAGKKVGEVIESLIEEQLAGSIKTKEEAVEFVKLKAFS